ncbi:MAG TPA: Holliday junction branch migration protein RuvA [Polyangiaceae bacterium]|jgi:Holliday junction DNA helicase RuvA|nr:Holliday junction branch migration protein RuvA [Polyangiaceae bacterium]
MIGRLTGRVLGHEADGGVVLDVGGVGYEVTAPLGTLGRAPADADGRVTLWIHTHVREDALALFGFADDAERTAFRMLIGVSNVGPKIAIAVLGALPVSELSRAVARRDLAALTAISGVGKKIAERLLLELRDRLPEAAVLASSTAGHAKAAPHAGAAGDRLRAALTGMGFKPAEADRAVASLEPRLNASPFEELLREALGLLAR